MPKKALIVIDVQNYFVRKSVTQLPAQIARFINKSDFDYVLFTKFVNRKGSPWDKRLGWKKMMKGFGTNIHNELKPFITRRNLFLKTSYSAFKSPGFSQFLEKHKVTDVYLCGLDIDSCILATAFEGFDKGYAVKVIKDLSASHSGNIFKKLAIKIICKSIQK